MGLGGRGGFDEELRRWVMKAVRDAILGGVGCVGVAHVVAAWKLADEAGLAHVPGIYTRAHTHTHTHTHCQLI